MKTVPFFKRSLVLLVSILFTVSAQAGKTVKPPPAPAYTWQVIGTMHAKYGTEHDTLTVKGPFDNFRRIKLKVTDAPLKLYRLVVTYDNGEPDKLEVREEIAQGGETRAIDLRGKGTRSIKKIEFWYETKGSGKGKADVTVYGLK
jgi:hypothetical protein